MYGTCVSACISSKADFLGKLDQDPTFTNKPAPGVTALVHPESATTFAMTTAEWTSARRTITGSNVWIHGQNVTIAPEEACYGASTLENDSSVCPDVDSGGSVFMKFSGNGIGIAGFTVRGFHEGLHFSGKNGTAGNMVFDRQCDDSITNDSGTGIGSEVRDTVIKRGCDKCTQDNAGAAIPGTCNSLHQTEGRGCYHMAYHNVDFDGCSTGIRLDSGGRFLVKDSHFHQTGTFACGTPARVGSNPAVKLRMTGTMIDDCAAGIILEGGVSGNQSVFADNHIIDNSKRGVLLRRFADATFRRNVIWANGGASESETTLRYYGGVGISGDPVADDATANLGTGAGTCAGDTAQGCNSICSNNGHANRRQRWHGLDWRGDAIAQWVFVQTSES